MSRSRGLAFDGWEGVVEAPVSVEIAYGQVTSATVTGTFAGTPTGDCVAREVRTGNFPVAQKLATPYPFSAEVAPFLSSRRDLAAGRPSGSAVDPAN